MMKRSNPFALVIQLILRDFLSLSIEQVSVKKYEKQILQESNSKSLSIIEYRRGIQDFNFQ